MWSQSAECDVLWDCSNNTLSRWLRDTVKPFDPFTDSGTGWTFGRPAVSGLTIALGNAIWTYQEFKKSWTGIEQCGMSQDLSCDNAAQQYEGVLLAAKNT